MNHLREAWARRILLATKPGDPFRIDDVHFTARVSGKLRAKHGVDPQDIRDAAVENPDRFDWDRHSKHGLRLVGHVTTRYGSSHDLVLRPDNREDGHWWCVTAPKRPGRSYRRQGRYTEGHARTAHMVGGGGGLPLRGGASESEGGLWRGEGAPMGRGGRQGAVQVVATSWRALDPGFEQGGHGAWREHDAVIIPRGGAAGRKGYDLHTYGELHSSHPTLRAAKEALTPVYGPLTWKRERPPKLEVTHKHFGPTTEFSSPEEYHFVHRLPRLG